MKAHQNWEKKNTKLTNKKKQILRVGLVLQLTIPTTYIRLNQKRCKSNNELRCFSNINSQASDYDFDSVYLASASL